MKVLIFGASGIIGQHMRLCCPDGVQPIWYRQTVDPITRAIDLCDSAALAACLAEHDPDVIVNLAGESRPDVVERDSEAHDTLNVLAPIELAKWCGEHSRRLVHVSSQAVFGGDHAPYAAGPSPDNPVNQYGRQKLWAETQLLGKPHVRIVRPTFVLGIRPLPHVGRPNPIEQMLAGQTKQVNDRWFSPLFASDAARMLWGIITHDDGQQIIHLGLPHRTSRYEVAKALGISAEAVGHDSFPGIAQRPVDTTYDATTARFLIAWGDGLIHLRLDWEARQTMNWSDRARDIALFLGITYEQAVARLCKGFAFQHAEVAADFRRANPQTDERLLEWYGTTEAYLWELSAYHADAGWNYSGTCRGIGDRLESAGARRVLCLGDGIGDLTLALHRRGFEAVYHDLAGSRTAEFAAFRFWRHTGQAMPCHLTETWQPMNGARAPYDAVVSLDFLEHVTDVSAWVQAIKRVLTPGGYFCAQNAFGIGSEPGGSLPMHLSRNDRYAQEWDPLLASLGFRQESSNWYRT